MPPHRLPDHGERDANGHIRPVRVLDGVEREGRFEDGDGAVLHFESRVVLPVTIPGVVLAERDVQHAGDVEDSPLAWEVLEFEV